PTDLRLTLFSYYNCHRRELHSFPTRRSSDLRTGSRAPDSTRMMEVPCLTLRRRLSLRHVQGSRSCSSWARFESGFSLPDGVARGDRKSTRLNSSHVKISYAVFCLKKKKTTSQ